MCHRLPREQYLRNVLMMGKIGWPRYLAFFGVFVISAIIGAISGALGPIGWVMSSILNVLAGIFLARTIGLLYDRTTKPSTQLPPTQTATR